MLLTGDSLRGGKCVAAPLISLWSPAHPVTQRGELGRRVLSAPSGTLRRRPPGTVGAPAPQPTGDTVTTSLTAEHRGPDPVPPRRLRHRLPHPAVRRDDFRRGHRDRVLRGRPPDRRLLAPGLVITGRALVRSG